MSATTADMEFSRGEVVTLQAGALCIEVAVATDRLASQYGPRFDRSAQVRQVRWGEREFLAEPGLPEEYGLWGHGVLGFEPGAPRDAPGEFVKVGVGRLRQHVPGPFKPFQPWPVVDLARNVVTKRAADRIAIEQTLPGKVWSYRQTKTLEVKPDGSLSIQSVLENLGTETIPVEHYNHNFFAAPADQRVTVLPAFPSPSPPVGGPWASESGGIVLNAAALAEPYRSWQWAPETGVAENRIELRWSDGYGVLITGDFPIHRVALWARDEMICPEVFYRFDLPPGESTRWVRTYQFRSLSQPGLVSGMDNVEVIE